MQHCKIFAIFYILQGDFAKSGVFILKNIPGRFSPIRIQQPGEFSTRGKGHLADFPLWESTVTICQIQQPYEYPAMGIKQLGRLLQRRYNKKQQFDRFPTG